MRCLVVGGGGREHALTRALLASPEVELVFASPGNPGIGAEERTKCLPGDDVLEIARSIEADLTVVGPEAPLVEGLVDRFARESRLCLGPTREAARLEGSKAFAKEIMGQAGVPTAAYSVHTDLDAAIAGLPNGPVVVKADGLCSGKGVTVAPDRETAKRSLREMMVDRRFGGAASQVLLEELLEGPEVSVIALCDGEQAICFPPAQDHKRLGDGDTGPNTGGMGAYAPAPCLDAKGVEGVLHEVVEPVLRVMRERGTPFRGFLYCGLILTVEGPKVLEFNVRFGDPEAQVILPLIAKGTHFATALADAARGRLDPRALSFSRATTACVVMASAGYPRSSSTGDVIGGAGFAKIEGLTVYHAGTGKGPRGELVTAGGRVLGVTGTAATLREALERCYKGVERLAWDGCQYRTDIGHRAL